MFNMLSVQIQNVCSNMLWVLTPHFIPMRDGIKMLQLDFGIVRFAFLFMFRRDVNIGMTQIPPITKPFAIIDPSKATAVPGTPTQRSDPIRHTILVVDHIVINRNGLRNP